MNSVIRKCSTLLRHLTSLHEMWIGESQQGMLTGRVARAVPSQCGRVSHGHLLVLMSQQAILQRIAIHSNTIRHPHQRCWPWITTTNRLLMQTLSAHPTVGTNTTKLEYTMPHEAAKWLSYRCVTLTWIKIYRRQAVPDIMVSLIFIPKNTTMIVLSPSNR